jgi:hypothetical protein
MVPWILLVIATLAGATGWYLFYRSVKIALGFDEFFQAVFGVLSSYSVDLAKMSKGDLLLDHPEVRAFHRRNLLALQEINAVLEDIKQGRPEAPKENLPRPDVE